MALTNGLNWEQRLTIPLLTKQQLKAAFQFYEQLCEPYSSKNRLNQAYFKVTTESREKLVFEHTDYSMSSKIEQKKWCATYSRCINALAEYQHSGNVTLYLVMDKRVYTFPDGFKDSAEAYLSHREKTGIIKKSNKVFSLYLERFFMFLKKKHQSSQYRCQ